MSIRCDRDDGVAVVTIDNPQMRNAMTPEMRRTLCDLFEAFASDHGVRAVVLTGAGGHFCSGADTGAMGQQRSMADAFAHIDMLHRLGRAIYQLKKPTIAAVSGVCVGMAWGLALSCDMVIAGASARFIPAFRRIGLVPDAGLAWHLARLAGPMRARQLCYSGEQLSAERACEIGLAIEVVDDALLLARSLEHARMFASGPPLALAMTKRQFEMATELSFSQFLEVEASMQPLAMQTADHAEGLAALRERRAPVFKGI
jgi:2-(1,2-epoxy-1,2-dihydrophenyl)acetyl-CoA isomerase